MRRKPRPSVTRTRATVVVLLAVVLSWWTVHAVGVAPRTGASEGSHQSALTLIDQGRRLLEKNCADCTDASADGLRAAQRTLQAALQIGGDAAEIGQACWWLARAYRTEAYVFAQSGSADQEKLLRDEREALACAVKAQPQQVDWLYEYAVAFDGHEERRLLEKVLELDPNHVEALWTLGTRELADGKAVGVDRMLKAFKLANDAVAVEIGDELASSLRKLGRTAEADEVAERVQVLKPRVEGKEPN